MRLVCPNCAAQYEVAENAIPENGRDVQCASCNETWFQARPNVSLRKPVETAPATEPPPLRKPNVTPTAADYDEDEDDEAPARPSLRRDQGKVDKSVLDILRSEAEREAAARDAEVTGVQANVYDDEDDVVADTDEPAAQPTIPLRKPSTTAERRIHFSAAGTDDEEDADEDGFDGTPEPVAHTQPAPQAAPAPKRIRRSETETRAALPDVDKLTSTLRSGQDTERKREARAEAKAKRGRSGAANRIGFYLAILLMLLLMATYALNQQITETVPAAEPYLERYVQVVNVLRHQVAAGAEALVALVLDVMKKFM